MAPGFESPAADDGSIVHFRSMRTIKLSPPPSPVKNSQKTYFVGAPPPDCIWSNLGGIPSLSSHFINHVIVWSFYNVDCGCYGPTHFFYHHCIRRLPNKINNKINDREQQQSLSLLKIVSSIWISSVCRISDFKIVLEQSDQYQSQVTSLFIDPIQFSSPFPKFNQPDWVH